MYNETITFYSKTPPNKWILEDCSISYWEENRICGDDLKVYIKIKDNIIQDWSFEWDTAIITTACASIFWESILGMNIEEIFSLDYDYIQKLVGMEISSRRRQASVLWVLSTRNALHKYLNDGQRDDFIDLIHS
jgi:nitrogen fixation NifU-like protein